MENWKEFQLASGIVAVPDSEVDEFRSFADENGDEYREVRRYDTPSGRAIVPVDEEDEFLSYAKDEGHEISQFVPERYRSSAQPSGEESVDETVQADKKPKRTFSEAFSDFLTGKSVGQDTKGLGALNVLNPLAAQALTHQKSEASKRLATGVDGYKSYMTTLRSREKDEQLEAGAWNTYWGQAMLRSNPNARAGLAEPKLELDNFGAGKTMNFLSEGARRDSFFPKSWDDERIARFMYEKDRQFLKDRWEYEGQDKTWGASVFEGVVAMPRYIYTLSPIGRPLLVTEGVTRYGERRAPTVYFGDDGQMQVDDVVEGEWMSLWKSQAGLALELAIERYTGKTLSWAKGKLGPKVPAWMRADEMVTRLADKGMDKVLATKAGQLTTKILSSLKPKGTLAANLKAVRQATGLGNIHEEVFEELVEGWKEALLNERNSEDALGGRLANNTADWVASLPVLYPTMLITTGLQEAPFRAQAALNSRDRQNRDADGVQKIYGLNGVEVSKDDALDFVSSLRELTDPSLEEGRKKVTDGRKLLKQGGDDSKAMQLIEEGEKLMMEGQQRVAKAGEQLINEFQEAQQPKTEKAKDVDEKVPAETSEQDEAPKPKIGKEKTYDLRSAVIEFGGIRSYKPDPETGKVPWSEEMSAIPPRFKRKTGLPLDEMFEHLKSAGWMSDQQTESDLIEMLQGSRKILSGEDNHYRDKAAGERVWRREGSETIESSNLKKGDKFRIQNEEFEVLEETDTALHIKDGEEFWIPYEEDETIRIDKDSYSTQEVSEEATGQVSFDVSEETVEVDELIDRAGKGEISEEDLTQGLGELAERSAQKLDEILGEEYHDEYDLPEEALAEYSIAQNVSEGTNVRVSRTVQQLSLPGMATPYRAGSELVSEHMGEGAPGDAPGTAAQEAAMLRPDDPAAITEAFKDTDRISSLIHSVLTQKIPAFDVRGKVIKTPRDFALLCLPLRTPLFESMKVAVLNNNGKIVKSEIVTVGILNASLVDTRRIAGVVEDAVAEGLTKVRRVVIGHNHPSGKANPSREDLAISKTLKAGLGDAGIKLEDHVITNGDEFYSWRSDSIEKFEKQHIAPWELVPATGRMKITGPAQLSPIVKALRTGDPDHGHVLYMDGQNKLVAIERIPVDVESIAKAKEIVARGMSREAAGGVLLEMPWDEYGSEEIKFINELKSTGHLHDAKLLDVSSPSVLSWREEGIVNFETGFASMLAEPGSEYKGTSSRIVQSATQYAKAVLQGETQDKDRVRQVLLDRFGKRIDRYVDRVTEAINPGKAKDDIAWPEDFPDVVIHTSISAMKKKPEYEAAKSGDAEAAIRTVQSILKLDRLKVLASAHPDAIVISVHAEEATGRNQLPLAYAALIAKETGLEVDDNIIQSNRAHHTGADASTRLLRAPKFEGAVQRDREYIIVDDVTTSGSTLAGLRRYIELNGGKVVAASSLATSSSAQTGYGGYLAIKSETLTKLEERFDIQALERVLYRHGIANTVKELTNSQGLYFSRFKSVESIRDRLAKAAQKGIISEDAGLSPEDKSEDLRRIEQIESSSGSQSASPMPGVPAFLGDPEPTQSIMDDNHPQRLVIEMPELVALSEDLLDGKHPQVKQSLRALFGMAAGVFKYHGKSGAIELKADIFDLVSLKEKIAIRNKAEEDVARELDQPVDDVNFKDPKIKRMLKARYLHLRDEAYDEAKKRGPGYAAKVLAHEIGHVIDWLPENIISGRGNILGRIAGLRQYMKSMLAEIPENQDQVLTSKERQRIRREAEREVGKRPPKDEKADLEAWKIEVKRIYDDEIKVQAEDRGLLTTEAVQEELQGLIAWWHGEEEIPAYYEKSEEMYAETLSVLLNNPAALAKRAPKFYHAFFAWMKNKPKVRRLYDQIQSDIKSGQIYRDRVQRLHQAFSESDARDIRVRRSASQLTKGEIIDDARYSIDRMFGPIYRRLGKTPTAGKVKHALENELYKGSEHELFMARVNEIVLDKLVANNLDWIQFGEYLFHQRVIHERFNMANPKGFTIKASNERLTEMQQELGQERYAQLEEASLWFRKVYEEQVVDLLKGSEVIDDDLMQEIEDRIFYATFAAVRGEAVLESDEVMAALDSRYGKAVSARIYRQIGTLGDIKNPASATMEKAVSLISMAYRETAKREVIDWMLNYSPSEVKSAEMRWTGTRREAVHVENDRIGTIEYLHKGSIKTFYVPKAIADSFKRGHPIENRMIIAATKYMTNPLKMLYTGANYGFWPVAFMRDMFDFARRMPKAALFGKHGYWKYHLKAWRASRSSVRGGVDPVAEEALKRKMLISVANPLGLNAEEEQFERLLAKYHQNPASWKNKTLTPMERIAGALRYYTETGQIGERTVKVAGMLYLDEHFPDMPEWQKQQMVHMHAGSPNFLQKGKANPLLDFFFLFYNPWKEGVRSEYDAWKHSKTEWLWKNTKYSVLPKVAMWVAAAGGLSWLIGEEDNEELKKMYDSISEYDKTNYMCVPLGWNDKEKEKVAYVRLPMSEGQRVVSGLTWKMLNRWKDPRSQSGEGMLSFAGGQLPSGNPLLNVGNAWLEYLVFGRNPYDKFRGRSVLRDDVFEAKDERAFKALGRWSANQLGAGVITRFSEQSLYDGEKTGLEKFLNLPVISNALGRWVKVSNRGIYDKMIATAEPIREERASKRLDVQENVGKLLDDDLPPDKFFEMLTDPYQKDYLDKKLPEVILSRELSPTVRSILGAGSKQEREHLAAEMMR